GPTRRRAARARLFEARRLRHDELRVGPAMGRPQRLAAARVAHDRRGTALRARRPGRQGGQSLASSARANLPFDWTNDGEVRRGAHEQKSRWGRVPDAGWIWVDQRRRTGIVRTAGSSADMQKLGD